MIVQKNEGHGTMQIRAAITLSALFLLVEPGASAAPTREPYNMKLWAEPGNCDQQLAHESESRKVFSIAPIREQMDHYLTILSEVITGDQTALKLPRICEAFGVDFVPGLLPPAHAEPWNPSPPPPTGYVFNAFTEESGTQYVQHVEATYTPSRATLSLSTTLDEARQSYLFDGRDYVHRDMGKDCPLRLHELTRNLATYGFSKKYYSLKIPDAQFAPFDTGVSVSFQRDNDELVIKATLQGRFVDQRTNPDASCLAKISILTSDVD